MSSRFQRLPAGARGVIGVICGIAAGPVIGTGITFAVTQEWSLLAKLSNVPPIPPANVGTFGIIICVVVTLASAVLLAILLSD